MYASPSYGEGEDLDLSRLEAAHLPIRVYEAGDIIYRQGERSDHVFSVISGWVDLHQELADGRRQISQFLFSGAVFGLKPRGVSFSHGATAITTARICAIPIVRVDDLRQHSPAFNEHFIWTLERGEPNSGGNGGLDHHRPGRFARAGRTDLRGAWPRSFQIRPRFPAGAPSRLFRSPSGSSPTCTPVSRPSTSTGSFDDCASSVWSIFMMASWSSKIRQGLPRCRLFTLALRLSGPTAWRGSSHSPARSPSRTGVASN